MPLEQRLTLMPNRRAAVSLSPVRVARDTNPGWDYFLQEWQLRFLKATPGSGVVVKKVSMQETRSEGDAVHSQEWLEELKARIKQAPSAFDYAQGCFVAADDMIGQRFYVEFESGGIEQWEVVVDPQNYTELTMEEFPWAYGKDEFPLLFFNVLKKAVDAENALIANIPASESDASFILNFSRCGSLPLLESSEGGRMAIWFTVGQMDRESPDPRVVGYELVVDSIPEALFLEEDYLSPMRRGYFKEIGKLVTLTKNEFSALSAELVAMRPLIVNGSCLSSVPKLELSGRVECDGKFYQLCQGSLKHSEEKKPPRFHKSVEGFTETQVFRVEGEVDDAIRKSKAFFWS